MKKKISLFIKTLAVGAVLLSLSGCIFFGPDGVITIQVTNNYTVPVDIFVKYSATGVYLNDDTVVIDDLPVGQSSTFIVPSSSYYTIEYFLSSQNGGGNPMDYEENQHWYDIVYDYDFAYEINYLGNLYKTY